MSNQKTTKTIQATTCLEGVQMFGYEGKVTLRLQNGHNKTIMSKQYHNTGMSSLFKFLCTALAGEYTDALRPCKIRLFTYKKAVESDSKPSDFNWESEFNGASATELPTAASPFVLYDSTPTINKVGNSYTTTFHFRIPCSLISQDLVHMIGFFSNNVYTGLEKDASAYYLLTEKNNDGVLEWAPLDLTEVSGSYSLIIDWTMSVENKSN